MSEANEGYIAPHVYRDARGLWYTVTGAQRIAGAHGPSIIRWGERPGRYLDGRCIEKRKAPPYRPLCKVPEVTLYFGPDLEEIGRRRIAARGGRRLPKVLPKAKGKWLHEHIFQTTDGVVCFDAQYLKKTYPAVAWATWYAWLEEPSADMGRTLRAFVAPPGPGSEGGQYRARIVWEQGDVEAVVRQVTDSDARRRPLTCPGEWLSDDLWQDREYGVCARDGYLSERLDVYDSYLAVKRRHRHPVLDSAVNGGKPRSRRVPKLSGRHTVLVSCLADFEKVVAWDRSREQRCHEQAPPVGWKKAAQLARDLTITGIDGKVCLSLALREFRKEHPEAAALAPGLAAETKVGSRTVKAWSYDGEAFLHWLGGRHVRDVAAPHRKVANLREGQALHEAVRFLQFVLTRGSFSRRVFRRFLAEPPTVPLQPCGPVPRRDIRGWARSAGIECSKVLTRAKREAGVKHFRKGRPVRSYWYLSAPVVIACPPAPARAAPRASTTAATEPESPDASSRGAPSPPAGKERVKPMREVHEGWERLHQEGKSWEEIARDESRNVGRRVPAATVENAVKRLRRERRKKARAE
jgi:hypothetical protein